jgi:hypothetical protein
MLGFAFLNLRGGFSVILNAQTDVRRFPSGDVARTALPSFEESLGNTAMTATTSPQFWDLLVGVFRLSIETFQQIATLPFLSADGRLCLAIVAP